MNTLAEYNRALLELDVAFHKARIAANGEVIRANLFAKSDPERAIAAASSAMKFNAMANLALSSRSLVEQMKEDDHGGH